MNPKPDFSKCVLCGEPSEMTEHMFKPGISEAKLNFKTNLTAQTSLAMTPKEFS